MNPIVPNSEMAAPVDRILVTRQQIADRTAELGRQITADYSGKRLLVMSVLKGSVLFLADIVRQIDLPLEFAFLTISSYQGMTSPQGKPQVHEPLLPSLHGKHVLIVEDILDSGNTLRHATDIIGNHGPKSVRTCILLAKEGYRTGRFPRPDYIGFQIPNEFVIGYGLDYRERFRNLPYVAVVRKEMLEAFDEW